jgi:hypothetical protein
MSLEQFAEDTITNWYAMGEKDFPTCLELAESLGLWNFAAELKLLELENQQEQKRRDNELRFLLYNSANPFRNESNTN